MGITTSQMSSVVGLKLDGILRANVTDKFVFKIRSKERKFIFDQCLDSYPVEMNIENRGGTAVMTQTMAGRRMKAVLTLGTRLSYVSPDMLEGLEPVGSELLQHYDLNLSMHEGMLNPLPTQVH